MSVAQVRVLGIDLDGTLLDSTKRHQILLDSILMRSGCEIDSKGLLEAKRQGQNTLDFLKAQGLSETFSAHVASVWRDEIEELEWLQEDSLYSDSWHFVSHVQAELMLCSARSNEENLRTQLEWLRLDSTVAGISCVAPDQKVIESKAKVWQSAGVDLIIGDSEIDALAAVALGLPFYLLHRGFRDRNFLASHGWKSHSELPNLGMSLSELADSNARRLS